MHVNEMQIGDCGEEGVPLLLPWSGLSVKDDK